MAVAPGGRRVVLKSLDEDCLWKGQLHPNVRDRLARVRELAHAGVANLYGVERDGGLTYLVWEYVTGRTLADRAGSAASCPPRDFLLLARETVLSVEMLHARGIVHGAVKSSNVIATADGRAVLTHVSPLLYTDPAEDVSAVQAMLRELLDARGEAGSSLGRLLDEVETADAPLRRLAGRLGALLESRDAAGAANGTVDEADRVEARALRRRAVVGAGATALVGLIAFVGLRQYANARAPKPPVPPRAAPAALQPGESSAAVPAKGEGASAAAAGGGSPLQSRRAAR